MAQQKADIALIGLAVMGQNLVLNMNDHGFTVCVFNRTVSKVDEFLQGEAKGTKIIGAHSLEEMVGTLKSPRIVMLLVMAGKPVDEFIEKLIPLLSPGDVIIDGGNSDYHDTTRRFHQLQEKQLLFVGCGVSGGEEGARHGPSLMPGGDRKAWPHIKPILQSISAKVNGEPCCDWVGDAGAGHYVKMVHNGIEYGDMQVIGEAYHLLKTALHMTPEEIGQIFHEWNKSELDSFLMEITANILGYKDKDGRPLVEKIRDTAGQKGTGKWTAISALDFGIPVTLIAESVFARCLSNLKDERTAASEVFHGPEVPQVHDASERAAIIENTRFALYASKIVSYAQGFMLFKQASQVFGWQLHYDNIAMMWRGGCIIRSRFLGNIKDAFDKNEKLQNLLMDPFFSKEMMRCQAGWRATVAKAVTIGVPTPAFSCALAFFDGYRCSYLPANLIQAQRDYFGAHQYEVTEKPGTFVHTNWTGTGGKVTSTTYRA